MSHTQCIYTYIHICMWFLLCLIFIKLKELTLCRKVLNFSEIVANLSTKFQNVAKFHADSFPPHISLSFDQLRWGFPGLDSRAEVCMQEIHPEHSHKHRTEAESRADKGVGMQQLAAAAGFPGISLVFSFFQTLNKQFSPPSGGFSFRAFTFFHVLLPPRADTSLCYPSSHYHSHLPGRQQGISTSFSLHYRPSYSHSPLHLGELSLVPWVLGPCFLSMEYCHWFGSVNLGEWSLEMRRSKATCNCQL